MTIPRISISKSSFDNDESERLMHTGDSNEWLVPKAKNILANSFTWGRVYFSLLHILCFASLFALMTDGGSNSYARAVNGRSWSPAHQYVEYEVNGDKATDYKSMSKYSGPPTEEQNEAWDALIRPVYFNATVEELEKAGESFVNMAELTGGGYPASLGVYHELHCVRQLRFYLYKDFYYPNLTEAEDKYLHGHLDHCLEALRLAVMCHGNTAMYTFTWVDPTARKSATQSNSQSACVKWSSIEDWGRSRMIPTKPSLVRPPV